LRECLVRLSYMEAHTCMHAFFEGKFVKNLFSLFKFLEEIGALNHDVGKCL
jgi:hypothetical protein